MTCFSSTLDYVFCGDIFIAYGNNVTTAFLFARHCDLFFITLELLSLFFRCSYIFYDVRITFYFGTFELHMEITLQ